jgi:hypothetical protein
LPNSAIKLVADKSEGTVIWSTSFRTFFAKELKMSTTVNLANLHNFTGTENYYRHWTRALVYTDGIHYLMENGAAWLVDAVASYQKRAPLTKGDLKEFQIWELESKDGKAVLTCKADSNKKPAITQNIEFTDFPEGSIKLYVELGSLDGVKEELILMLTSER